MTFYIVFIALIKNVRNLCNIVSKQLKGKEFQTQITRLAKHALQHSYGRRPIGGNDRLNINILLPVAVRQ